VVLESEVLVVEVLELQVVLLDLVPEVSQL
jgi:hypothetical protein